MHYRSHRRKNREKGAKSLFKEIMADSFPNLGRVHDVHNFPYRFIPKRTLLRYVIIKLSKTKDRISKAGNKNLLTYKGTPRKLSEDFSAETLQARRKWVDVF